ncbi:MAG: hypothetical protein ABIJ15_06770 [bacterium]
MTIEQRELIANGLINLGNIAAGLLIFGQFVSGITFRAGVFIIGLIALLVCYIVAIIARGGD